MVETTMRIERAVEGDLQFSGKVSVADFARLRLDNFDRALLADCEGEGRSAADWLLALETIFRRMQEQRIVGVAACQLCEGTGRYGDGKHDGSGRWIECPNCTDGVKEVGRG